MSGSPDNTPPEDVLQAIADAGLLGPDVTWARLPGGRTSKVWRLTGSRVALICKLSDPAANTPLFPNDPSLEWQTLVRLSSSGIAPVPVTCISIGHQKLICTQNIAGQNAPRAPAKIGHLLRHIHSQPVWSQLPQSTSDPAELLAEADTIARKTDQDLQDFRPELATTAKAQITLIHRDPVCTNLIDHAGSLKMLDWQCPAAGDPCEDLAHALSPTMQVAYGQDPWSEAERHAMLDSYGDEKTLSRFRQMEPFYSYRMAAYAAWKSAQGDPAYNRALRAELSHLDQINRR